MTVFEELESLGRAGLIGCVVGVGLLAVGLGRIVIPRFVAAWRVVSEAKRDTTGGVHRVNPEAWALDQELWDLADSVESVRDIRDGLS